jgi:hypothetical protein
MIHHTRSTAATRWRRTRRRTFFLFHSRGIAIIVVVIFVTVTIAVTDMASIRDRRGRHI